MYLTHVHTIDKVHHAGLCYERANCHCHGHHLYNQPRKLNRKGGGGSSHIKMTGMLTDIIKETHTRNQDFVMWVW